MKFLCVECDEPMTLLGAQGPDNGSLSVLFECGSCGKQTAMLTNHMETQMIHSLGVKVGGRTEPAAPMETIRENLDGFALEAEGDGAAAETTTAASGATGAMSTGAGASGAAEPAPHSAEWYAQKLGTPKESSEGGCPFSGMVAPQIEAASGLTWTAEAEARMERIPSFVRPMVQKGIEDMARAEGATEIDRALLERARAQMGM